MENILKFTEAEEKIRNRWFYVCQVLPASLFLWLFFISPKTAFHDSLSIGILFRLYFCAYKKPGVEGLLLYMFCVVLAIVVPILKLDFNLFHSIYYCFQLYFCYQLKEVNKNMQARLMALTPEYQKIFSSLSTATNLEELDRLYSKIKASTESGKEQQALFTAYGDLKRAFDK